MKRTLLLSLTMVLSSPASAIRVSPLPVSYAAKALLQEDYTTAIKASTGYIGSEEDRQRELIAARAYFALGRYEEAARLFELIVANRAPIGTAEALFYAAESRFRTLERVESKKLFSEFVAAYPAHRLRLRAEARLADISFALGEDADALTSYQKLSQEKADFLDPSQLLFSSAVLWQRAGDNQRASAALLDVWRKYPSSPAGRQSEELLRAQYADVWASIQPKEKVNRATALFAEMAYEEACAIVREPSLSALDDADVYTLLGKCALQDKEHIKAGELLLKAAGEDPALWLRAINAYTSATGEARSEGYAKARELIAELLKRFPEAKEAQRAQYKAAWLDYHEGKYKVAIKGFEAYLKKFPDDADAQWYTAWSAYLMGDWSGALASLEVLAKSPNMLQGGKGKYWLGKVHERLNDKAAAIKQYRDTIGAWPFSYYAMLSQLRLKELGEPVIYFEEGTSTSPVIYSPEPLAVKVPVFEAEPSLADAKFWLSIGYQAEAKEALDVATSLLQSAHPDEANLWLCALYQEAGEFKRPLELAWEKDVLRKPPVGEIARWWTCGYPKAHELFVTEAAQREGVSPYFVWSLMRQESSYSPYLVSKADAVGLLQLLPKTARKVAQDLGTPRFFIADLFRPKANLRLAASYIQRLMKRFNGQLWLTAAAYNGGPGAVDRWLKTEGARPFDEWVEQISYSESREYLKKISGHYARYQYLYEGKTYELETGFSVENDASVVDW